VKFSLPKETLKSTINLFKETNIFTLGNFDDGRKKLNPSSKCVMSLENEIVGLA
jgi:hypothetical protein